MVKLEERIVELECLNCNEKIKLELNEKEWKEYSERGNPFNLYLILEEYGEAYLNLFDGFGWVLHPAPYCDICKYEHGEGYEDFDKDRPFDLLTR